MNDRSRPAGAASESIAADVPSVSRGTDNYPVTGTFVVDLTKIETEWPEPSPVRQALWPIGELPRGAHVRLIVGRIYFHPWMVDDLKLDHVAITVESGDLRRLPQWIAGLREAR